MASTSQPGSKPDIAGHEIPAGTQADGGRTSAPSSAGNGAEQLISGAAVAASGSLELARRILPARGGLPLYAGLGGLAVIGVIEWPVAFAAGAGYGLARLLRRGDEDQKARTPD